MLSFSWKISIIQWKHFLIQFWILILEPEVTALYIHDITHRPLGRCVIQNFGQRSLDFGQCIKFFSHVKIQNSIDKHFFNLQYINDLNWMNQMYNNFTIYYIKIIMFQSSFSICLHVIKIFWVRSFNRHSRSLIKMFFTFYKLH